MKTAWRITLFFSLVFLALAIAPYTLPVRETGADPVTLADDPVGGFVTLQGVRVYYEDRGVVDAPVIVLLHGLFGSTESWRYNVDMLAESGFRVLTFDRPGFGLSDKPAAFNYSVENQARLTLALLDNFGINRATILGHSAGGNVAARVAFLAADRVERLVLVDAAVLAGGPPSFVGALVNIPSVWRWGRVGLQAYFVRERFEQTLRGFYASPDVLTKDDYDAYWRAFETVGWDVALLSLTRDSAGGILPTSDLATLTMPTLILWGDQDTVTPVAQAVTLNGLLSNSTLDMIQGIGHQPFDEAPDAFNQRLVAWLQQTGSGE